MATLTIRNLDDQVKAKLRLRAARRGHSMEEEARHILRAALSETTSPQVSFFDAIRRRIEPLGGVDLDIPVRQPPREPPTFD